MIRPQFVAVEGPSGVGKTAVAERLADRLAAISPIGAHLTCEPTRTPLGQMLRKQEAFLTGRAFALAQAADRAAHIETEIIPQLDDGRDVVVARYLPSSLVQQRLDGLDLDEAWGYNQYTLPATVIDLEDNPAALRGRLSQRPFLSRFQHSGSPERELALFRETRGFLASHEWTQHSVTCAGRSLDQVVQDILTVLSLPVS